MSEPTRRQRPQLAIDARVVAERNAPQVEQMRAQVPEILNRNGIARERRDPTAATQSLRWISPGRYQPPDWNAATAFAAAYYQSIVVYACVRLLANTIASLPFRAGADPNKPHDYNMNAPLSRLLGPPPGGPAPKLSSRRLWAWTVAQRVVTGRNGWEIEINGDVVAALWPLASSALNPIPSDKGVDWYKGFVYGRPGDLRNLSLAQVVYDWDPSGLDFRQPESALQAANLPIATSVMQGKYDFAFLKNDARPPAIVVTEQFADDNDFQAFKQQWNSDYQGPDNAGRIAFLEAEGAGEQGVKGAVDVTVLGISQKDAQTAQRHAAAMEHTAIALGTPWSLLDASGRTYDNAGVEWKNYVTHRVAPLCSDLADMVNMQLAPQVGSEVGWFDMSRLGIEAMDRVDAQGAAILFSGDIATKNEARAPFGLPPVKGDGDKFASELGLAPVAQKPAGVPVGGPPANPAPPATALAASVEPGEERKLHEFVLGDDGCATCGKPFEHTAHGYFLPRSVGGAADRDRRDLSAAPVPEIDHRERRARLWRTSDGKVRNLERQWTRAMRKLFARQQRSALARLEGKRGRALARGTDVRATADEVFDPDHWLSETIDDVTALYEAVTAAGGARVSDLFGLAFDLEAPYAQEFIAARAKQLAGYVTDTTYGAIQDALREGVAEGEAIPDLAARIEGVFSEASTSRATTIARTETVSAFNGSASLTAQQYGSEVVAGQEWIAEQDDRTRETHSDLDGTVIGMGETFDNGCAYPGDPSADPEEVVNCRCTLGFLTPEEMGSRSGGRSKVVPLRMARSLIAMVRPGEYDEKVLRRALEVAA